MINDILAFACLTVPGHDFRSIHQFLEAPMAPEPVQGYLWVNGEDADSLADPSLTVNSQRAIGQGHVTAWAGNDPQLT